MNRLKNRHLLGISDLETSEIRFLLSVCRLFHQFRHQNKPIPKFLSGKTIAQLFFENSTRTKNSFDLSIRQLGGATLGFSASTSSQSKGESVIDTIRTLEAMQPDCFVIRHALAGTPELLSKHCSLPIINAGDGFHEHPTQALLDAFTMEEALGNLKGKTVLLLGDVIHARVALSNIRCLKKLGAKVILCGPPSLMPAQPKSLGVEYLYRPEPVLPQVDFVMTWRIQMERQNQMHLPSLKEYRKYWGITPDRANLMKPEAKILHPGPLNRGVEIDPEVADGPRSLILKQVQNGVTLRAATLAAICQPKGLEEWIANKL